jgi:alkylation response protein AidB-like acyl-CoA dehydrogenase
MEALLVTSNVQTARNRVDTATSPKPPAGEAGRILAALRELAPEFAARSKEIEDGRRVPRDIADKLRRLGLFRTLLPRSLGGLELSAADVVPMIETMAAADSSVGWVTMIGTSSSTFCTRAPRAVLERIYLQDPDAFVVGVGTPAGRGEKVKGKYRISGRWPFASGCQNAQWIGGHFVICEDGQPVMSEQGPQTRFFLLPGDRWQIEETWQASGLTGTGSHHVVLNDAEVPEEDAFDLFHGTSSIPGPFESAVLPFNASFHSAVAVGIAAGATAELAALAGSGRRQLFAAADLKDLPIFQHEFGRLNATLRAARALIQTQVETHWQRAIDGTLDNKADLAEGLQGSAWVHAACSDVVSGCYTLGGSSSIMNASPLQRRLRDIHAARQHFFAQERYYGAAGKNALGFPPVDPLSGH